VLLLSSCIEGYDDDWTFNAGVKNTQLESPADTSIVITKNADGSELIITWPVIYGAKGYEVSIYNVDDPSNPHALVDKLFVDGCSTNCEYLDDTKYRFEIRALGNPKYNNKDAEAPTIKNHSTLLPAYAIIPTGTDLYQYFTNNVIPDSTLEVAYELEPNGEYTVSGPGDFQKHWIVLRGDKIYHPKITYAAAGRISTTSGITIKYINFDLSAVLPTSSDAAVLSFSSTPDPAILGTGSYYILKAPKSVLIYSCNFNTLNTRLINDNGKKYCIENLTVKNCIFPLGAIPTDGIVFMKGGFINNFYFNNNTIYGTIESGGYFLKYENSGCPDRAGFVNATININTNTFYNVVKTGQMANYPGMNKNTVTIKMNKNIFIDCGSNYVIRRLAISSTNIVKELKDNCYWFAGAFPQVNEVDPSYGDKSGTAFGEDPQFADPSNGNFTIGTGATQILEKGCGDPRWLPAN